MVVMVIMGVNRDIFYDLYLMYKCFSIPGWHYDLFFSSLARPLLAYQILFEETEEGIQPVEVRINEEVRGRLVARTEAEIHNLIYDVDTIQAEVFLLNEPYDSHITVLSPWMESKDNPFIFWDLVFKNKQNTNMNIDFLTQLTNWTEKEFINYAKEKGIKIGVKTLYNYRDYALFPIPYKVKVKGKNINYYDREWIKYLEWINEKKKEKPEKSIESFRDLPEAEEFFKDIPDIRKEIKKKKKKRLKSGKSK